MIVKYLPWLLSAITIWMTLLAGNLHPKAWLVGLLNQALWLVWIVHSQTWGLIPLNVALWIVYGRNHLKWQKGASASPVRDWALKWGGTLLFIVWEISLRVRGKWRRSALRDWLSGRSQ